MDTKEKWIKGVENSLEGIQPSEPNPYLYTRILSRLDAGLQEFVPVKFVWFASASLLLVLLLNFFVLKTLQVPTQGDARELKELSRQFQLVNTNTIDYR